MRPVTRFWRVRWDHDVTDSGVGLGLPRDGCPANTYDSPRTLIITGTALG